MKAPLLLLLSSCVAIASGQVAAPFGIRMKTTMDGLKSMGAIYDEEFELWELPQTPVPNPYFKRFDIYGNDYTGVCKVSASTGVIKTDASGKILKDMYNLIRDGLEKKYGKFLDYTYAPSKIEQEGGKTWMYHFNKDHRQLRSIWNSESDFPFPNDIESVDLYAKALSADEGFIGLTFTFTNINDCL